MVNWFLPSSLLVLMASVFVYGLWLGRMLSGRASQPLVQSAAPVDASGAFVPAPDASAALERPATLKQFWVASDVHAALQHVSLPKEINALRRPTHSDVSPYTVDDAASNADAVHPGGSYPAVNPASVWGQHH